jgi:outer membrane protein assembly factor BamB
LYALDATTGEERWRFQTGDTVWSSPAVANGVVYVGSFDGNLYALDAATGQERWRLRIVEDATPGEDSRDSESREWIFPSPAVVDGVVYIGSGDGYLYAITEGE